jgi:hypothetical protein
MMAIRTRRNLIESPAEDFRPPVFKPNTSVRNRLENRFRRFLDLQAGSAWRDVRAELSQAAGKLIDIGCGAQIYRSLVPVVVAYHGIDTSDAKARFGYSVPDTHYVDGETGASRTPRSTLRCAPRSWSTSPIQRLFSPVHTAACGQAGDWC